MPERGDDADGRFKAGFQTVERVVRRRDERIDGFVVLEQSHERAVADRTHIVRILIVGGEETVHLAVRGDRGDAQMRMLAVARETDEGFRLEIDLKAVQTEDFAHDGAHEQLVVRRLDGTVVLPVDFDLLADMRHAPVLVDLRLETADLLVSHLHVEAVFVQFDDALLERRAHRAVRTLPILLVHHL